MRVSATQPAKHRHAIVLCCDQNYLPYALNAASQINALHPTREFDICVCYGERAVSIPNSLEHLDIRLCHFETGTLFDGLRLDKGKSHDVYLRLALPEVFAADYDRILYMDSDIFVQGGDFHALLQLEFDTHPIAAVRDNSQWRSPNRRPRQFKVLGLPSARYFNAGVILMDVARYNAQGLLQRCVDLGRAHADQMIRHDQNLYNAVLQGAWAEISPMWNWQFTWSSRLFASIYEPHVVHFIGSAKPWNDPLGQLSARYARDMRRFAERHFHDFQWPEDPQPRLAPDSLKMRKTLLKHLTSGHRMARYMARFPNDRVVHTSEKT